jgi:flagellar hook-associated protein 2
MPVRMTGLISQMDTESLIKGMVDAQRLKNKKVEDKSTLLGWKQDKWKELNKKLYKLYTEDLSKMRLKGNYQTKKVSSSNENVVSVTAGQNAPEGSHIISDIKLASGQYITGIQLSADKQGDAITGNSKLVDDFNIADGTLITVAINGDTKTVIDVDSTTTINSFVQRLRDAGLNASYDTTQKRFFISSKNSGEDNKFTITTSTDAGLVNRRAIDQAVGYSSLSSTDRVKVDEAYEVLKGVNSTILDAAYANPEIKDTDDATTKAVKTAVATLNNLTTTKLTKDAKNTAVNKVKEEMTNFLKAGGTYAGVDYTGVYDTLVNTAKDELRRKYDDVNLDFTNETYKQELDKLVETYVNKRVASDMSATQAQDIITAKQNNIIDNGILETTNVDGTTTTTNVTSKAAALSNLKTNVYSYASSAVTSNSGELSKLGLTEITKVGDAITVNDTNVILVAAKNSEFKYNGATLTGTSNVISANGLTFTLKGETSGETISLNVNKNSQETYDMVKNFIKSYNEILKEMNDLYYARSSRGYKPLSDDEKEAMTDDQIEKWETKIQDSILRRDTTLGTLLSEMKNAMLSRVEVDGKNYSLSNYGIQTSSDYTEKGLLHIYGNKEDGIYSALDDKLMKALEEDPDTVVEVLSKVSTKLYETMADKMSAIPNVRSAFTFYNDKVMLKEQDDYKKQISILEKKLVAMEDKYYKQFAAMETTLAKLQQQTNALTGMLGIKQ